MAATTTGFAEALRTQFPDAVPLESFADHTRSALGKHGFTPDTTLLELGTCRDELASPLFRVMQQRWGWAFGLAGLAGMLFLGRTGLTAAQHHIPDAEGAHRFLVVLTTHIGIDADGTVGRVQREGQRAASSACGALAAFRGELAAGTMRTDLDRDDLEQSLLRLRLLRSLRYGQVPDLVELTRLTRDAILEDYLRISEQLTWGPGAQAAIFTGILVHGPDGDWLDPHVAQIRTADGVTELPARPGTAAQP